MKKVISLFLIVLFIMPLSVFAQRTATQKAKTSQYVLTVNAPKGATIYIDGNPIKGSSITLPSGSHNIRVSSKGYSDFEQTVNLTSNLTINANLQPSTYTLTVNAPQDSIIYVDKSKIKGNTISVTLGSHTVLVTKNGYLDYTELVDVKSDTIVNAQMQEKYYTFYVNSNVKGTSIYVNNIELSGDSIKIPFGKTTIVAYAEGYEPFEETVMFSKDKMLYKINMKQLAATLEIITPSGEKIDVLIDNVPYKNKIVEVKPGTHIVTIKAGNLSYTNRLEFKAGKMIVLSVFLGVDISYPGEVGYSSQDVYY